MGFGFCVLESSEFVAKNLSKENVQWFNAIDFFNLWKLPLVSFA